ncbi:MAG TPA: 2-dehydropantoate 2-reductase [Acidimicrobiales bacterium]|nr:2-dehydropantoate 2-reductase [Acidimicrobiales bacterium]
MRFIVFGAGAVGGVVGGRLAQHGHDVVLIARGGHYEAIRSHGLRLRSPDDDLTLAVPVAAGPDEVRFSPGDVVLLAVKSHGTQQALDALAASAPRSTPVVCLQNGVENERAALRIFPNVYGICVMLPATHLVPGEVRAHSAPVTGILDIGRFPSGTDATAEEVARALAASTFVSEPLADVMRWKYTKLLMNLANAIQALCSPPVAGPLADVVRREGVACLTAAGIGFASDEEDRARRADLVTIGAVGGEPHGGGSSWQSVARGLGSIETDYLNGEIVLLGRLHGVPTPANDALQQAAAAHARARKPPGRMSQEEFLRRLG